MNATKMAALIARGLVEGCACGCRGDFVITPLRGGDALQHGIVRHDEFAQFILPHSCHDEFASPVRCCARSQGTITQLQ